MFKTAVTKTLSFLMSLALVTSSMPVSAAPVTAAPMPDFVKALTPSEQLGFVDGFYKGSTEHPVILIQDLHANYGVQQKIGGLLEFLQPKVAPTGRSMVLGIEGAWGEINLSGVRSEPEEARRTAANFLLKESEISAMEHFAALSKTNVHLVGIDNPDDYTIHVSLFRKSLAARLALAQKTDKLRSAINASKAEGPRDLRRIWRLEEDFHAGRLDLATLSRKLKVPLTNYGEAEAALAREKTSLIKQEQGGDKTFFLNNLIEADQNLSLLGRLLRQQLTFEEVQYAAKRIPTMLATIRALLPAENLKLWNDTIRTAIDHYAVALVRNKPMAEHAIALVQKHPDSSVVLVAGGFHTAGIVDYLKQRKTSYVVIAPVVESHTSRDEEVYMTRMMDMHVSDSEIAAGVAVPRSAQTVNASGAIVTFARSATERVFSRGSQLWPRTLSFSRRGTRPTAVVDAAQIADSQVLHTLAQSTVDLKVPSGLLGRFRNRFQQFRSADTVVDPGPVQGAKAVDVSLKAVQATAQPASSRDISKPLVATGLATIGAIITSVRIHGQEVASSPAVQKVIEEGQKAGNGDSSVLAYAIGAVATVATVAAAWHIGKNTKVGRRVVDTARDAIYATQA